MNRFRINKIGLLNFWLYDEEEYDFYGGNLILRGTNGSGKSVTMQSFIPLILDGNKSPERLDPFGSKDRKIEDYILGDSESIQKEESTAYLYMELFLESENKYITIGLGFRGRKGKPTESWGFSLKDGKRIGKNFFLYKDISNKIPLSKNELKSRLGNINEFYDTMKEYKSMVNRLIFGFPTIDVYDEFIKLLLQLRSNKLSKDYKPTNLINVLNTVLQPLTEEDLRPLSEAIEQMNKTKEQVEILEKNSKFLKDFLKVYKNYNEILLLTKARNYQRANSNYINLKKEIDELELKLKNAREDFQNKTDRYSKVLEEIAINTENKKQLDNQDLKRQVESLSEITNTITNLEQKLKELDENIQNGEDSLLELNNKINEIDNETYKIKKELDELGIDLKSLSDDSYFDEIVFFIDELNDNINSEVSFDSILMSLRSYTEKVSRMLHLLEEEEKILLESENTRIEFEKLTKSYQETEKNINNQEKNLNEAIMAWEEDFINKINNNKIIKLEDVLKKEIFNLMQDYSSTNYDRVKEIYNNYARKLINDIISNKIKLENKRSIIIEELNSLKEEYQQVRDKDTLELKSFNEETDEILKQENIVNIPLYQCLEFKENIKEDVKNNIEASLLDLNFLNAKIIKEKDIEKVDKLGIQILYLIPGIKKKNNLLKYFDVSLKEDSLIDKKYIESILESISIEENDTIAILEDGKAKLDVLRTVASKKYIQSYIGYLKRVELKNKKLKELEAKQEILEKEILNITNLITEKERDIELIENEKTNLPSNDFLANIVDKIKELKIELSYNDKRQKELENTLSEIDNKLKNIKEQMTKMKEGLYIPLNLNSYKEVAKIVISIREGLQNLKGSHKNYLSKIDLKNSYQERANDIEDNVGFFKIDKNEKEKELKVNMASKKAIEELLETKEYKDQKEKIMNLENTLRELEREKETLIEIKASLTRDIEYLDKNLDELSNKMVLVLKEKEAYQEIFLREYKLEYVYKDEINDINKKVKEIIRVNSDRKEFSLNDALNRFYSSYNQYSLELNEYSLKNIVLFADYENISDDVKKIYEENIRADVSAMYQGVKVNIIELFNKIESDIEENKELISKQDRHLFEDILLNTVGDKIRKRIESSNEWVTKINNIMAKMQENSALSFKLVWRSIAAENEGEIDTRELVRILKMDPKLLKESDAEKLTNHFRSKIKRAEELYQDSYISFYKIIEEVLDYRSWFTFQLLYQRKGMSMKELTDKTFSKFSGGERAKSMYIPLFASCYAKLNLAKNNALRIIALDEAFAGVDEENIREMFGILKYLDLNFIINSQVLWGDYDTIDDLSICELIRPRNSQVVTVERYRWNGKYKEIITNRTTFDEVENVA